MRHTVIFRNSLVGTCVSQVILAVVVIANVTKIFIKQWFCVDA